MLRIKIIWTAVAVTVVRSDTRILPYLVVHNSSQVSAWHQVQKCSVCLDPKRLLLQSIPALLTLNSKKGGFPKVGLVLSEQTRRIALLEDSTTPVAQVTPDLHLLKIAAAWLGNRGHGAPASCTIGARPTAFQRNYTHTQTHVCWSAHMLAHGCNFLGVKNWNDGLTKITVVWSFLTITILLIVLSFVLSLYSLTLYLTDCRSNFRLWIHTTWLCSHFLPESLSGLQCSPSNTINHSWILFFHYKTVLSFSPRLKNWLDAVFHLLRLQSSSLCHTAVWS